MLRRSKCRRDRRGRLLGKSLLNLAKQQAAVQPADQPKPTGTALLCEFQSGVRTDAPEVVGNAPLEDSAAWAAAANGSSACESKDTSAVSQADPPFHVPARPQRCLAAGVVQIAKCILRWLLNAAVASGLAIEPAGVEPSLPPAGTDRQRPLLRNPTAADSPVQSGEKPSN